jgi:hypothetical protein
VSPEAQVERCGEDPWAAQEFLEQARRFLDDGRVECVSTAGRQVLLHNATVAACDAILAMHGLEVTGTEGGHVLRLEEAHRRLGRGHADLFERLDEGRDRRVNASYRAGSLDGAEIDVAVQAVTELVVLAVDLIKPRLPGWAANDG